MENNTLQSTYRQPFVVEFDEMQHTEPAVISEEVPDLVDILDLPDLIDVSHEDFPHHGPFHSRENVHFRNEELNPYANSCSHSENLRQLLQTQRSKGRWERFRR